MSRKLIDRPIDELVDDIVACCEEIEMHLYNDKFGVKDNRRISYLRYKTRKLCAVISDKGKDVLALAQEDGKLEYALQFI